MDILLTSDYYVDIVVQEKFEVYFLTKGQSQARILDIYSLYQNTIFSLIQAFIVTLLDLWFPTSTWCFARATLSWKSCPQTEQFDVIWLLFKCFLRSSALVNCLLHMVQGWGVRAGPGTPRSPPLGTLLASASGSDVTGRLLLLLDWLVAWHSVSMITIT